MSITTYSTLKSAVFNFSGRDDLSESFDTFLQLTEQAIYHNDIQPLHVQDLITTTTLTTVAGTNSLALPSDFLSSQGMVIVDGGAKREMKATTLSALRRAGDSGIPEKYAISGANLVFDYIPDGAYDLELNYYAQPVALDETNNTNTILTKYPSIYLYGCLSSVANLSGEDQDAERFYQMMIREIKGAIRSSRRRKHAPGAAATTRGPTP